MLYPSRIDLRGLEHVNRTRELTKPALSGNLAPFPPRPPFRHPQRQARVLHERHCQGLELDDTSVVVGVGRVWLAEVDRHGVSEEAISLSRWLDMYPRGVSAMQVTCSDSTPRAFCAMLDDDAGSERSRRRNEWRRFRSRTFSPTPPRRPFQHRQPQMCVCSSRIPESAPSKRCERHSTASVSSPRIGWLPCHLTCSSRSLSRAAYMLWSTMLLLKV